MKAFVQWHEGMLISPHHFQQSNNYVQRLFSELNFVFSFGVHELKIDTSALASGVIRVLKARGVFQDGCYFDFDAVHDKAVEKNLTEYFAQSSIPIKIYLAIPARRIGDNMLTGDMARYYSDEITGINDENIGTNPINIPIIKPKLRLLTENEIDERYTSFPIFEAKKSVEGGIVGTDFIPPFLSIDEHSKISEISREIVQIIRNKISYFSDRKDNYARSATEESMTNLRLLIQAALPLESIIRINGLHPFEIYKCFMNAAALIISINPSQLIPNLPIYQHNDLLGTFDGLMQYAKNILQMLKQKYDIISFTKDGNVFSLKMKQEWLSNDTISIGIQKSFSASNDEILSWISGAQIASESMIPLLREKRVLGADRSIMERGSYITQPSGMIVLSVKCKNSYIKSHEKLCLVNNAKSIVPEEVVLYAES